MSIKQITLLIVGISWSLTSGFAATDRTAKFQAPLFSNLGRSNYPIMTSAPMAQRFFNQGMILFYGFEWGESIRSFKEAARLDPACAMCYWGVAIATSFKVNAPETGQEYAEAKSALQLAQVHAKIETPVHQALISALSFRFQQAVKPAQIHKSMSCHSPSPYNQKVVTAYINAMKQVAKQFPDDMNAKDLYGVALFWDIAGKRSKENNPEVKALIKTLDEVLLQEPLNVGANHYLIHAVEAYSHPDHALASAERLRNLVPGSEHLVHMPSHIYFLTGNYAAATEANLQAIKSFEQYNNACLAQGFKPEINYLYFHNYDFLRSSASIEGRSKLAITTAEKMLADPFPNWLQNNADLQWFIPIPYFVKARFGLWQAILQTPAPSAKYQYALGMWHYVRGLAYAKTDRLREAQGEIKQLNKIIQSHEVETTSGLPNQQLLRIAQAVLMAVISNEKADKAQTLLYLNKAAKMQAGMGYHEPPDWYFPLNQALGDAYLRWGMPAQAKIFYEKDLKQYPANSWSLYGLALTERALHETDQAKETDKDFKNAWKKADIPEPITLFNLKKID